MKRIGNVRRWRLRRVHNLGAVLVVVALASALVHSKAGVADSPASASIQSPGRPIVQETQNGTVTMLESSSNGIVVEFSFHSDADLYGDALLGGALIPPGWRADIEVTNISSTGGFFLNLFDSANAERHLGHSQETLRADYSNCGSVAQPLSLGAAPYGARNGDEGLTIRYFATLSLADCVID